MSYPVWERSPDDEVQSIDHSRETGSEVKQLDHGWALSDIVSCTVRMYLHFEAVPRPSVGLTLLTQ